MRPSGGPPARPEPQATPAVPTLGRRGRIRDRDAAALRGGSRRTPLLSVGVPFPRLHLYSVVCQQRLKVAYMLQHVVLLAFELLHVSTSLGPARHSVGYVAFQALVDAVRATFWQSIAANLANLEKSTM